MQIIESAMKKGQKALSEFESKEILRSYGIPTVKEKMVHQERELFPAVREIGYPVVLKACSPEITHKTERRLIAFDLRNDSEVLNAHHRLSSGMKGMEGGILVQEMVKGRRELVLGLIRDPQFGPCVMFGLGGIFSEILRDVCFRVAPITQRDALDMMTDIKSHKILGAVRGMEEVRSDVLSDALVSLGRIGLENNQIKEIDINPLIVNKGMPVAVDALVVLQER